jgi:hypothetical protein
MNNSKIDLSKAEHYFNEAKKIFDRDSGKLWGINMNGPIMFIHPESRDIVANQQDPEKVLVKEGNLYIGKLPKEYNPANSTMKWNGIKWTTVLWYYIQDDEKQMLRTLTHESFHRIQDQLWFKHKADQSLKHFEEIEARVWFKLERNAVLKALKDNNHEYIKDALIFKNYRRSLYQDSAEIEDASELHESLAVYTELKLTESNLDTIIQEIISSSNKNQELKNLHYAYPYIIGKIYGFLLDKLNIGWINQIDESFSCNKILSEYINLKLPEDIEHIALERSKLYKYNDILEFENERLDKINETINKYLNKINHKPLVLNGLNASISFRARMMHKIENNANLIDSLRSVGNWGILEVRDGIIINSDYTEFKVSEPMKIGNNHAEGDDWSLELNKGYEIKYNKKVNVYEIACLNR